MKHYVYILAICLVALLPDAPAPAAVINLHHSSVATGVDDGPQDGAFDSFTTLNLGSVNNNGYTSFRTAFEFSLFSLPAGLTVGSADLLFSISNFEGTRTIEVHGYPGDGSAQLSDFALNGLVAAVSVSPDGTQTFSVDVTDFVANAVASDWMHAGFNVREESANATNFTVMGLVLAGRPLLSIDLAEALNIDIKPGGVPNSINRVSQGKIPVAILSSPEFNAPGQVDRASLTFGRTGNETSLVFCNDAPEDVNDDGLPDMICHFHTQSAGFLPGDAQGTLKGNTLGGVLFQGTDSVRILR